MNPQNNDIIVAVFAGSFVLLLLASFGIIFTLIYFRKKKNYKLEKDQLQAKLTEQLLKSQLEIREQTLKQVSMELHDNLGQIASLIKINLLTLDLDDKSKTAHQISTTMDLVRKLIADLKTVSMSIKKDTFVHTSLPQEIQKDVQRVQDSGIFDISFFTEEHLPTLDNERSIIVFRIFQECLTNAIKHSQATELRVNLRASNQTIMLELWDNGIGFDSTEAAESQNGSGIANMMTRASLINARFTVQSSIGMGTKISLEIPNNQP